MQTTVDEKNYELLYIGAIQSLGEEFSLATSAIARNDLNTLEKRIAAQQILCEQLAALRQSCSPEQLSPAARASVRAALRSMEQKKRVFTAAVALSGRAQQVMLALCWAYKSADASSGQNSSNKLSCEV